MTATWQTDATRPGFTHPDTPPTRSELEADEHSDPLAGLTPCPFGCGAGFHGESKAYRLHLLDRTARGTCRDPWERSGW